MYAIKMNSDKSLVTTIHASIYQNERNTDTLVFLIPKEYEKHTRADCSLMLRYILPDGTPNSEVLEMRAEPYNNDYYQYHLGITTKFTAIPGEIELWLNAYNPYNDLILNTSSVIVEITEVKEIPPVIPEESTEQIRILMGRVSVLEKEKADNIIINNNEQYIQLSSDGNPVGVKVGVDLTPDETNDEVINF